MDTELKKMGKSAKVHALLRNLEYFIKAVVHTEIVPESANYYDEYIITYDMLHEFLVKFIDLHMDK